MVRNVLLVEDEPIAAQAAAEIICASLNYTPHIVSTGAEALVYLEQNKPVFVVLDCHLSDMNSEDLIRRYEERSSIGMDARTFPPFIVLTEQNDVLAAVHMMKLGAQNYIVKDEYFPELFPFVLQALATMLESEERLRNANQQMFRLQAPWTQHITDAIILLDNHFRITDWNPAAEHIYGWSAAEAIGQHFNELLPMDFLDGLREEAFGAIAANGRWQGIIRQIAKKGAVVILDASLAALKNESGERIGTVLINRDVTDITKQKEQERVIHENDGRYRLFFHHSPVPMCIYDPETLRLLDVNAAFVTQFGYTQEELLTMTKRDLHPSEEWELHGQTLPYFGQQSKFGNIWRYKHKNGSLRWVEIYGEQLSLNGKVVNFASVLDVNERVESTRKLEEIERRFALILNNITDIIVFHRPDGSYEWVSPSYQTQVGYTTEDTFGTSAYDYIHPDDMAVVYEGAHQTALQGIKSDGVIFRFRRKDGVYIWAETITSPILNPATGEVQYILAVSRDITERVQSYQNVQRSEAQFRSIIDSSPVPYALNDKNNIIMYLNPAFIKCFGYTLEDIPTLAEWWVKAYPDEQYRQWVRETWRERLDTAQHKGTEVEALEVVVRCKDGSASTVLVSANRLEKEFQDVYVVIFYDITERKAMDKALRESEERYRSLFNVLEEGIAINEVVFDENGDVVDYIIIDVNPAFERHSPYTITEALGKRATDLYKMDTDFIRGWWKKHIALTRMPRSEYYHEPTDMWFDIVTTLPEKGRFATIFINITDRIQAEKQIRRLALIAKETDNMVIITDTQGNIEWVNEGFIRLSEYNARKTLAKRRN
jgi:PAS domain S-box-containing protein